ncbi:MAG: ABC transporter ATP-binding protein [Erysipelotrichaceae bacterium]|nr:ABC transporter ATP-binding protein [Erysipelotrichaceae bacterium]
MIRLNNVEKKYHGFDLKVSMNIKKGSITGLIGKNGAGKSTIYKAILNLIKLDGGDIKVFDQDAKQLSNEDKAKIGVILADSFFGSYLNIKDIRNILRASYEEFDEDYFNEKVKQFGLPVDKAIKDFSFGMRAKLKMLCALSHNAKLLLLDEPTLGLDVIAREEILEMLREYMAKDEDNTILISSHIASDLEHLCDEIFMIDDGRIILHEDSDVLLSNYGIIKVSDELYASMDLRALIKTKKEDYGYMLLVSDKQYYIDNYKDCVVEQGGIDNIIYMMVKGE